MKTPIQPLADLTERALSILVRELGVADTARFLQLFSEGNYTEERKELFSALSLEDLLKQSRNYNQD